MKEEIVKKIVGGVIVVVLGGSAFAVSQTDVVNNFAQESGMTQQEAQEYVDSIQDELASFSEIGEDTKEYGQSMVKTSNEVDCYNYAYEWESSSLSCAAGKKQLYQIGTGEISLGECFIALDTDLGSGAKSKIQECISYLDKSSANLELAITGRVHTEEEITDTRTTNTYNKSVLKAALEAE